MGRKSDHGVGAFTLIELLVVVAIIAVLLAILVPALHGARDTSRLTVCGSNLRQIGFGIMAYANDQGGYIPRGPEPAYPNDFTGNQIATNQIWVGAGPYDPPQNRRRYQGLGPLLVTTCPDPKVYYCPSDNNYNLALSEPFIGTDTSAYGSYTYRQLDLLPADCPAGVLDKLGRNRLQVGGAEVVLPVEALAVDTNSLGPEAMQAYHTNHGGRRANALHRDASVRRYANDRNCVALPPEAFQGFPGNMAGVVRALDQLFWNLDYAYRSGAPGSAPPLPPP